MAKITVPLLPQATQQYDQTQMAQLVQTLEQLIFALNNTYTSETLRDDDEAFSFFLGTGAGTTSEVKTDILTNKNNISTNTTNIATNTSNISTNTSNISTNTSNISTNTTDISALEKQTRYSIIVNG